MLLTCRLFVIQSLGQADKTRNWILASGWGWGDEVNNGLRLRFNRICVSPHSADASFLFPRPSKMRQTNSVVETRVWSDKKKKKISEEVFLWMNGFVIIFFRFFSVLIFTLTECRTATFFFPLSKGRVGLHNSQSQSYIFFSCFTHFESIVWRGLNFTYSWSDVDWLTEFVSHRRANWDTVKNKPSLKLFLPRIEN